MCQGCKQAVLSCRGSSWVGSSVRSVGLAPTALCRVPCAVIRVIYGFAVCRLFPSLYRCSPLCFLSAQSRQGNQLLDNSVIGTCDRRKRKRCIDSGCVPLARVMRRVDNAMVCQVCRSSQAHAFGSDGSVASDESRTWREKVPVEMKRLVSFSWDQSHEYNHSHRNKRKRQ